MITSFLSAPGMRRYDAQLNWGQGAGGIMVLALTALMFVLGVYPQPFLELIQAAGIAR
jgi:NADH-quinone oxidoreductase subunit N